MRCCNGVPVCSALRAEGWVADGPDRSWVYIFQPSVFLRVFPSFCILLLLPNLESYNLVGKIETVYQFWNIFAACLCTVPLVLHSLKILVKDWIFMVCDKNKCGGILRVQEWTSWFRIMFFPAALIMFEGTALIYYYTEIKVEAAPTLHRYLSITIYSTSSMDLSFAEISAYSNRWKRSGKDISDVVLGKFCGVFSIFASLGALSSTICKELNDDQFEKDTDHFMILVLPYALQWVIAVDGISRTTPFLPPHKAMIELYGHTYRELGIFLAVFVIWVCTVIQLIPLRVAVLILFGPLIYKATGYIMCKDCFPLPPYPNIMGWILMLPFAPFVEPIYMYLSGNFGSESEIRQVTESELFGTVMDMLVGSMLRIIDFLIGLLVSGSFKSLYSTLFDIIAAFSDKLIIEILKDKLASEGGMLTKERESIEREIEALEAAVDKYLAKSIDRAKSLLAYLYGSKFANEIFQSLNITPTALAIKTDQTV